MKITRELHDLLYAIATGNEQIQFREEDGSYEWTDIESLEDLRERLFYWNDYFDVAGEIIYELRVKPVEMYFNVGDRLKIKGQEFILIKETQDCVGLLNATTYEVIGSDIITEEEDITMDNIKEMYGFIMKETDIIKLEK